MESFLVSYPILCCVTLIIGWLVHWLYRWANPPCKGTLPPGSMGFPIIGESFRYFKPSPSIGIPSYYQERLERYGPLFKTSLVGQRLVVSLDPELDQFILQQEGKLFRSWYPEAVNNIFGKKSFIKYNATIHKFVRSFASKLFGIESLREVLIRELEDTMRQSFAAWATKPSIEVMDSVSDMTLDLVAKKMIGMEPAESRELRKNFKAFFSGINCFPIYFPGTLFYKCMKGRKNVRRILTDILKERLSTPGKKHGDLVDLIVEELRSEKPVINEHMAADVLAAILFASFAAMSTTLVIAFKFLTDNPKVVETLKEEHETILKRNFMPFGGGMRLCLGADFSKLFIPLFLHILVTKYRWIEIKGGEVYRVGGMLIPEGYHIQLVPTS